ncbi:putative precursor of CEP13/CEP14 [Helianthus anomalus]
MARVTMAWFVFVLILICCVQSLDARKLLNIENGNGSVHGAILEDITTAPTSHRTERLIVHHLDRIDRILESVPSPGMGH